MKQLLFALVIIASLSSCSNNDTFALNETIVKYRSLSDSTSFTNKGRPQGDIGDTVEVTLGHLAVIDTVLTFEAKLITVTYKQANGITFTKDEDYVGQEKGDRTYFYNRGMAVIHKITQRI